MRLLLTSDVERFSALVEGFLVERVERNVLATVLSQMRTGRFDSSGAMFGCALDERGAVQAVVLRTPPWPLLASGVDARIAEMLVERWIAQDPSVPGVSGEPRAARALARAWTRHAGGSSVCRRRDAMHVLNGVVDPPRPAAGRLRLALEAERSLLIDWERAFCVEAGAGLPEQAARAVAARLADRALFVWDEGGPVSNLALSPASAGTVRIGPVYTPPSHRSRGYASSAVAAASRHALAGGARRCMLFADLANPTSNKIYSDVGFRRFADWEEHEFLPA